MNQSISSFAPNAPYWIRQCWYSLLITLCSICDWIYNYSKTNVVCYIGTLVIEIAEKTYGTSTYKNLTYNKI